VSIAPDRRALRHDLAEACRAAKEVGIPMTDIAGDLLGLARIYGAGDPSVAPAVEGPEPPAGLATGQIWKDAAGRLWMAVVPQ
jgi:hypothetical protein